MHRDVKPANTLIRGKLGRIDAGYLVADFGLSIRADGPNAEALRWVSMKLGRLTHGIDTDSFGVASRRGPGRFPLWHLKSTTS